MPLTKSDIPDLLLPGLKADFALAYRNELANSVTERIATVVNTTMPVQKYAWLGAVPPMREFIDEQVIPREDLARDGAECRIGEAFLAEQARDLRKGEQSHRPGVAPSAIYASGFPVRRRSDGRAPAARGRALLGLRPPLAPARLGAARDGISRG